MELSGEEFDNIYAGVYIADRDSETQHSVDGGKTVKGGIQIQPDRQDRSHTPQRQRDDNRIRTPGPEDRANQMIREAEMAKARIFNQSGEKNSPIRG